MSVCFNYRRKVRLASFSAQYLKIVILKGGISVFRFQPFFIAYYYFCLSFLYEKIKITPVSMANIFISGV